MPTNPPAHSESATAVLPKRAKAIAPAACSPVRRRVIGLICALAATGILGVAAYLEPAADGLGTHTHFNLPQCGWIVLFDTPCPTCGWTTAFAHAANGDLPKSFHIQPMGCLLSIATAMVFLVGSYVAVTGSTVGLVFLRLWGRRTGWFVIALILAAWVYKVLSYKGLL